MPTGFNRLGKMQGKPEYLKINIFESYAHLNSIWGYDKFNIPCWKYCDEDGNTIVRGLCPRRNEPFLHVILEDCRDKINCLEITKEDIERMD
jgi:hypothetical protein